MNPFNIIAVYTRLYADCLAKAFKGIRKNLWTLLLPIGLSFVFLLVSALLGAVLGRAAGFVIVFAIDAVFSAYLYFVAEVVQNSKASVSEWSRAFRAYFWSVMNVGFILYITDLMLDYALATNQQAHLIRFGIWIIELVLLSAVPEVLYQRNTYGFGSIGASIQFVQENWIEWFLPHVLVGAAMYFLAPQLGMFLLGGFLNLALLSLPIAIVMGAFIHVFMIFRGHLFEVLSSSTHRQRMFRYRGNRA